MPRRRWRRRALTALAGLAALLLVAAAGLAVWAFRALWHPFQGYAGAEAAFQVEEGEAAGEILARLEAAGILRDATVARVYLVYGLGDPLIKAGDYRFTGPLTARQVLRKLVAGEVETESVTLVEGLTLEETAVALVTAGFGELDALLRAMRDGAVIADLDPAAADLEGYLFPDTYSFARGTPESEVVGALVANFRRKLGTEIEPILPAPAPDLRRLLTLASIVEKEGRLAAELPLIAGVYRNRLERGMALYADPTVIFALKRRGQWDGNLTRDHLQLDSPYNTYRYPGLPPGPICSPGLAALIAAARPAEVPYLYFVSRNDGSHVFAATLAEHNRNVERWQRRYWRERRLEAAADEVSGNN